MNSRIGDNAIEARRKRMESALSVIKVVCPIAWDKARALLCHNQGISDNKAREYINIFIKMGFLVQENGGLRLPTAAEMMPRDVKKA